MIPFGETRELETLKIKQSMYIDFHVSTFLAPGSNIDYLMFNESLGPFYLDQTTGKFQRILVSQDTERRIDYFIDSQNERFYVKSQAQAEGNKMSKENFKSFGKNKHVSLLFDLNSKQKIFEEFFDPAKSSSQTENLSVM